MSTPRPGRPPIPHWRKLYEEAILEVDTAKIPDRVKEAKEAIQTGIHELSSVGHYEECRPLFDALNILDDLSRMYTKKPNSAEHQAIDFCLYAQLKISAWGDEADRFTHPDGMDLNNAVERLLKMQEEDRRWITELLLKLKQPKPEN